MNKYLAVILFAYFFSFAAHSEQYELLSNGSQLLVKEKRNFVFVGTEVIAPIPLPFKGDFFLLTPSGESGYTVTAVDNTFDLTSWTLTEALVFKGDFTDSFDGEEFFFQGKGISLNGGASNAYITSNNMYRAVSDSVYSEAIRGASSVELSMGVHNGHAYLLYDEQGYATVEVDINGSISVVPKDIGSLAAYDKTVWATPLSAATPSGAFETSYPVSFPAADGGLAPGNIVLKYTSSNINNASLGYRFQLDGLELIKACTYEATDPGSPGVKTNLTSNPRLQRLCYEGLPLVADTVGSGAYGPISGEWYHLQGTPTVKAHFNAGNEAIVLYMPNGIKKEFERKNDFTYALTQVIDQYGNVIDYGYADEGSYKVAPAISTISWAGYKAIFDYSTKRHDIEFSFDSGNATFHRRILSGISIYESGNLIKKTSIKYKVLANSLMGISGVQTCYYVDHQACEAPVEYTWESESANILASDIPSETYDYPESAQLIQVSDFNLGADGFIYLDGRKIMSYTGKVLYEIPSNLGAIQAIQPYFHKGIEGLLVMMYGSNYKSTWYYLTFPREGAARLYPGISGYTLSSTGVESDCYYPTNLVGKFVDSSPVLVGDADSDGYQDIYLKAIKKVSGSSSSCLSASSNNESDFDVAYGQFLYRAQDRHFYVGDSSGIDQLAPIESQGAYTAAPIEKTRFVPFVDPFDIKQYVDIDGNGVKDEIVLRETMLTTGRPQDLRLSIKLKAAYTGDNLSDDAGSLRNRTFELKLDPMTPNRKIIPFDIDSDGESELVYLNGGKLYYYDLVYSYSTKDVAFVSKSVAEPITGISDFFVADVNGDGRKEIVAIDKEADESAGIIHFSFHYISQQAEPLITKVVSGSYEEQITYSDNREEIVDYVDSYNIPNGTTNIILGPQYIIQRKPSHQVVEKIEKLFKSGGLSKQLQNISYKYERPLMDTMRGWNVGFRFVTATDHQRMTSTEKEYFQYPFGWGHIVGNYRSNGSKSGILYRELTKEHIGNADYAKSETVYDYANFGELSNPNDISSGNAFGIVAKKETAYFLGQAYRVLNSSLKHDAYGRTSEVAQQTAINGVDVQNSVTSIVYKYKQFGLEEPYNNFVESQDTNQEVLAVNNAYLRQAGLIQQRMEYVESNAYAYVPGISISSLFTTGGYQQTGKKEVAYALGDKGNPSRISEWGGAGSTENASKFINYENGLPTERVYKVGDAEYGTQTYAYDTFGNVTSETSVDGITTTSTFDGFGRKVSETSGRESISYSYSLCSDEAECLGTDLLSGTSLVVSSYSSSGKRAKSYFDEQGRNFASSSNDGLDNTLLSWVEYDAKGRVYKEYQPCKIETCNSASPHTQYSYEADENHPWDVVVTYADGTSVTSSKRLDTCANIIGTVVGCTTPEHITINPGYIEKTETRKLRPKLDSKADTTDASAEEDVFVSYSIYSPLGDIFSTVQGGDTAYIATLFKRNVKGDVTEVYSDTGNEFSTLRQYAYYDTGELKSDTNAIGVKKEFGYDENKAIKSVSHIGIDGLLYSFTENNYDSFLRLDAQTVRAATTGLAGSVDANSGITTFNVDVLPIVKNKAYAYADPGQGFPANYRCGKYWLCSEITNGLVKHFNYTEDGLLKDRTEINTLGLSRTVAFSYGYDAIGQLTDKSFNGYHLTYTYHNGNLTRVTDGFNTKLWELMEVQDNGSVSEERVLTSNSLVSATDELGRSTTMTTLDGTGRTISNWNQGYNHLGTSAYRQSAIPGIEAENFVYDAYGQIDATEMAGVHPYDYSIDKKANLTSLRGTALSYGTLSSSCAAKVAAGGLNSGVSLRSGSSAWMVSGLSSHSDPYCYDQLGRQVINGQNSIEYTADSRAARIKNANADIIFGYDASGVPVYEQQSSATAAKNYTAWIFDNGNYEVRDDSGTITTRIYPTSDTRLTFTGTDLSAAPIYHYVMTDTMGSVTGLALKSGSSLVVDETKRRGYTPYGAHRDPNDWSQESTIDIGDAYGFTGQRYLSEFGVYQFVGRIYDPAQGRFTGPDPIVSMPLDSKSYNPYAYAINDPLGYTDPSGHVLLAVEEILMAEIGIGAGFSANWNQQMLDQSVGNNNFVTTDGTVAPPYTQPVADSQPISMVNIPDNADLLAGIATELVPEILEAELYIHGIFEGIGNIFSPDGYQGAEDMGPNIMYSEGDVTKRAEISTGRTEARNLKEQLAMEEVKSNPSGVTPPRMPKMSDTKNNLLHEDGWVKRTQNVNGVEIHYVENINTKEVIDFKFKD